MSAPKPSRIPICKRSPGTSPTARRSRGDDPQAARRRAARPTRRRAPRRSPRATPARSAELDGARPRRRDARARRDRGDRRPRRHLRAPRLLAPTPPTRPRRAAAARRGEGHRDRDRAAVLPPRVGGAGRRARRGAARHRRARLRPPPPAHGAPLPPAPAHRARGEDPHREGAHRAARAWARLFEEQTAAITVDAPTRPSRSRSTSRSRASFDPTARCASDAAERVTAALQPGLRTRAYTFNTLLADKMIDDRLRAYPHWLASRNLSNEASDESVQALIEAVRDRYELPRRWYRLKAQLLGIDQLADYDRMAAVTQDDEKVALARGQASRARLLRGVLRRARRARAAVLRRALDRRRRCGPASAAARSAPTACRRVHPYVLLNYTLPAPRRADAGARARPRRARRARRHAGRLPHGDAADAGRDRVGVRRDARVRPAARARRRRRSRGSSLLAESIEGSIATVFRQVAMNRFEHLVHTARRERGRAVGRPLRRAVGGVAGGAAGRRRRGHRGLPLVVVLRPPLHRLAGLRLRVRLRAAARAGGLRPLRGGGRRLRADATSSCCAPAGPGRPRSSGEIVGVDLADPGFWDKGLDLVERKLDAAEAGRARRRPNLSCSNTARARTRAGCS